MNEELLNQIRADFEETLLESAKVIDNKLPGRALKLLGLQAVFARADEGGEEYARLSFDFSLEIVATVH